MDYTKDMEMACELLHEQLGDLIRKIKNNGMSTGDLEKLDKLTHSLKSVKGTMQMEKADEEGYSGMYPYMGYGRAAMTVEEATPMAAAMLADADSGATAWGGIPVSAATPAMT